MIQLEDIRRVYDGGVPVLDAVRLSVKAESWCMITGPSGSGKTTLAFILGLLDPGSGGRYILDDQVMAAEGRFKIPRRRLARLRLEKIGLLYQDARLLPHLPVIDNIALPCWLLSGDAKRARRAAETLSERLGIAHLRDRKPAGLSGGEKQRTAFARALINHPALLLADEPTGNLDRENTLALMELLKEENRSGMTIVMVTHDRSLLEYGESEFRLE